MCFIYNWVVIRDWVKDHDQFYSKKFAYTCGYAIKMSVNLELIPFVCLMSANSLQKCNFDNVTPTNQLQTMTIHNNEVV